MNLEDILKLKNPYTLLLVGVLVSLAAVGCSSTEDYPDPPLEPQVFAQVLDELYTMESGFAISDTTQAYKDSVGWLHYQTMLKRYAISQETFQEASQFYLTYPELLQPVVDSLTKAAEMQQFDSRERFPDPR